MREELQAAALKQIAIMNRQLAVLQEQLELTEQLVILSGQPELPVIESPVAPVRPAVYPRSDNFCICGHAETEHAGPTRGCAHIQQCDCEGFIPANKAGAPGGAGQ